MKISQQSSVAGVFRRYPVASACVVLWGALLIGLFFRFGALDEGRALLEQKETEGKRIERNVLNGAGLDKQVAALKASLERLESKLIKPDDVGPNQQYFYELEGATGVKLSTLRSTGVPKSKGTSALFRPVGYNVVVEGRFPQVLAFVQALEIGGRHYRLVDYTIQRTGLELVPEGKVGNVVLNLNLELLASL